MGNRWLAVSVAALVVCCGSPGASQAFNSPTAAPSPTPAPIRITWVAPYSGARSLEPQFETDLAYPTSDTYKVMVFAGNNPDPKVTVFNVAPGTRHVGPRYVPNWTAFTPDGAQFRLLILVDGRTAAEGSFVYRWRDATVNP